MRCDIIVPVLCNTLGVLSIVCEFGHTFENLFTTSVFPRVVQQTSLQCPHVHLKSIHNIKQNTLINNATNALPLDALLSLLTMN